MKASRRAWLAIACAAATSCGGDDGKPRADADADALFTSCTDDPRAERVQAGMAKPGEAGLLTVTLLDAAPAPPAKGTNRWTIRITDRAGAPVDGLVVAVVPFMPDHNHGSSLKPTVAPTGAPGEYAVDTLYFFMLGLWRVTVTTTGPTADTAVFQMCVTQ